MNQPLSSMNILDVITNRRTLNNFSKLKVSDNIIHNALLAANHAPCHRLTFPWRFNIVSKAIRHKLFTDYINIKFPKSKSIDNMQKLEEKFMNPSHLIIASQILNDDLDIRKEDYAACSCAIQNIMLYLSSEGVGSKWATGKNTRSEEAHKIIKLDKEKEIIIGFIWIGYGEPIGKIKRPSIESIVIDWN